MSNVFTQKNLVLFAMLLLGYVISYTNTYAMQPNKITAEEKKKVIELCEACKEYDFETINRLLIEIGDNINWADKNGYTVLISMCIEGSLDVIKMLVDHGANPFAKTKLQSTTVYFACRYNHLPVVYYLAGLDVPLNTTNDQGETTLHVACRTGSPELIDYLIEHGSELEVTTPQGLTPFLCACRMGNLPAAKHLVSIGANTKALAQSALNALHLAANSGSVELVKYLIDDLGFNVLDKGTPSYAACTDKEEELFGRQIACYHPSSFLHYACLSRSLPLVKYLVEKGVEVNIKGDYFDTPLHCACQSGSLEVVKYLIEKEAKIFVRNVQWLWPLHLAEFFNHRKAYDNDNLRCGYTREDAPCGHTEIVDYLCTDEMRAGYLPGY